MPLVTPALGRFFHRIQNNLVAGIHNATPEYAKKMINIGFQIVTVGSDKIFMSDGAKSIVNKIKN